MKRFYAKFRIALMTFALGLASVFVMNGSLRFSDEVSVNLPEVQSNSIIFVIPKKGICAERLSGSHAGFTKEFWSEWELHCLPNNPKKSK